MAHDVKKREFLHSLSRIIDRMRQLDKDLKRFKKDFATNIKALCEDARMARESFESLCQDISGDIKNNKKKEVSK